MPDLKISQLNNGDPAQTNDQIPINRAGVNFSVTAGSIASLATANSANTEVLFNNNGVVDGDPQFTFNPTGDVLSLTGQLNVDNVRVDGNTISSTNTNGNLVISPNGTGDVQLDADTVRVGDAGVNAVVTTNGAGNLTLSTNEGTNSGTIVITQGVNGNIIITPNGTGDVLVDADTLRVGDSGVDAVIQSNGNADLILRTGNATTGSVTLADGANGNLTVALNGTGQIVVNAGAVGTPTIAPTGDLNTGIYFPAADTIAFVEGGVESGRFDSNGNLLIGTTTNTNSSRVVANGTISETVSSVQYLVASQFDVGTAPNQIPLNQYLGALAYENTEMPALNVGTGISTGTGTICRANAGLMGGVYQMTILIDLTGLNSGGTAGDIIGVNGTALPCYIAQLPAMTVLGGRMTCLETPAGGDTDIDLYSATEGTGVEDQAITALTETQIINAGTQSVGTVTYFSADPGPNVYFYLVGQSTSNATYTAGRFLIEVFGVQ
jgi:hypothetical protein